MRNSFEKIIECLGEDFKQDWRYIGGDFEQHSNYLDLVLQERDLDIPPFSEHCICGQPLKYNCYIYNPTTEMVCVIGYECIKRFDMFGRRCKDCDAIHINRVINCCNDCKKNYRRCVDCNIWCRKTTLIYYRCMDCHNLSYIKCGDELCNRWVKKSYHYKYCCDCYKKYCKLCDKLKNNINYVNCYACNMKKKHQSK